MSSFFLRKRSVWISDSSTFVIRESAPRSDSAKSAGLRACLCVTGTAVASGDETSAHPNEFGGTIMRNTVMHRARCRWEKLSETIRDIGHGIPPALAAYASSVPECKTAAKACHRCVTALAGGGNPGRRRLAEVLKNRMMLEKRRRQQLRDDSIPKEMSSGQPAEKPQRQLSVEAACHTTTQIRIRTQSRRGRNNAGSELRKSRTLTPDLASEGQRKDLARFGAESLLERTQRAVPTKREQGGYLRPIMQGSIVVRMRSGRRLML